MTKVPAATAERRAGKKLPMRDLLKLAFHAGQGMSSAEIAEVMGEDFTGGRVRWALRKRGIRLAKRNFDNDVLPLRWKKADTEALTRIAFENEMEPADLAVVLLRVLLAEPVILKNLLDEVEMIDEARQG